MGDRARWNERLDRQEAKPLPADVAAVVRTGTPHVVAVTLSSIEGLPVGVVARVRRYEESPTAANAEDLTTYARRVLCDVLAGAA